jgi:membrane protease YdiL (CAAX protease family)
MRSLTLLVLGSLLVAALASPPIYAGLLELFPDASWPFRRVFNRVAMLAALIFALSLRRKLGLRGIADWWRLENWSERGRTVGVGTGLTLASGLIIVPFLLAGPVVERSPMPASALGIRLLGDAPGALVVGLIEECFFRILVLDAMRRAWGTGAAVLASSAFYAALHFLRPDRSFVWDGFSPTIGLRYLASILGGVVAPENAAPFVGLFLIGLVLALALLRTGSLGLCIGLHAGWFLVRKLVLRGTRVSEGVSGGSGGVSSQEISWHLLGLPATWASIALVGLAVFLLAARWGRKAPGVPVEGGHGASLGPESDAPTL